MDTANQSETYVQFTSLGQATAELQVFPERVIAAANFKWQISCDTTGQP